ncbi:GAG-pre-integrase domain-containing protein, partial [Weizmannia coagulans]|nr:GAG-pre-integrase domain-containing protein [Heyndrickxia coagulans]
IGSGHVFEGHYILDRNPPKPAACIGKPTPLELHCRLGHPSISMLKKVYPQFSSLASLDCESCHLAKHHRLPSHPRVHKRVDTPFELVHSDVW